MIHAHLHESVRLRSTCKMVHGSMINNFAYFGTFLYGSMHRFCMDHENTQILEDVHEA